MEKITNQKRIEIEQEYSSNIKKVDKQLNELRNYKKDLEEYEQTIYDTFNEIKREFDNTLQEYIKEGATSDLKEIDNMIDVLLSDFRQAKASVENELDYVEHEEKSALSEKRHIEEQFKHEIANLSRKEETL